MSFTKANGVYSATITASLANGQSLGFKKLPAGTKFSTTETLGASSIDNKTKNELTNKTNRLYRLYLGKGGYVPEQNSK